MVRLDVPRCTLGEGPLWHRETQEFVFADIVNGKLYAWKEGNACRTLLSCRYQLGAFLFDAAGDLILFTEEGVMRCPYGTPRESAFTPLFPMTFAPGERFNDAICTPDGRMIGGTKTEQNTDGTLYLFSPGQAPRVLMSGLQISNGMGFSPDGEIFYHTDSGRRTIYRYAYDRHTGSIHCPSNPPRAMTPGGGPFGDSTRTAKGDGGGPFGDPVWTAKGDDSGPFGDPVWTAEGDDGAVPDGMTVDADGNIWTALWGRGCVICIDPAAGSVLHQIHLPACQVSSVTFGGEGLSRLLVTSAQIGSAHASDGEIYALDPGVSGLEEYRAQ